MKPLRALAIALTTAVLSSGCYFQVAWLPDGQHLAYLRDGSVRLIDLAGHETVLYGGLKEAEGFVVAAPVGSALAISGDVDKVRVLAVVDDTGTVKWSRSFPGTEVLLWPGCWNADATRLVGLDTKKHALTLVDLKSGEAKTLKGEKAVAVRFAADGDVLCLRAAKGGAILVRRGADGKEGAKAKFALPKGYSKAEPRYPAADGTQVWFTARKAGKPVTLLVAATGAVVVEHAGDLAAVGPDDTSAVTDGHVLVRTTGETDLAALRARVVGIERNWQMADPEEAKKPFDEAKVDFHPVFSPDGKKAAFLTGHLLCVADLSSTTGEVSALAKW